MSTLLQDETGQDDEDARPRQIPTKHNFENSRSTVRHLEHDPIAFRREQETVAQLIHQVSASVQGDRTPVGPALISSCRLPWVGAA